MEATSFWTIAKLSPEINKIGYKKKKTSEIKLIFFLLLSHRTVLVIPLKKKNKISTFLQIRRPDSTDERPVVLDRLGWLHVLVVDDLTILKIGKYGIVCFYFIFIQ